MKCIISIGFFLCLACYIPHTYAQVDEIKDKAEEDKQNNKSDDASASDRGRKSGNSSVNNNTDACSSCLDCGSLFLAAGALVIKLQKQALEKNDKHPEVISLELPLYAGYNAVRNTAQNALNVIGNWGIFATHYRYMTVGDNTGFLDTHDWQILRINIPVYPLRFYFGGGFSYLSGVDVSYFDSAFGLRFRFFRDKFVADVGGRVAPAQSDGDIYRSEFKFLLDYELLKKGKFRISPMAGVLFQNYFYQYEYLYYTAGVNLRLF